MDFDLDQFDTVRGSEEGRTFNFMRLDNPTLPAIGPDGKPLYYTMLGPYSERVRAEQREITKARATELGDTASAKIYGPDKVAEDQVRVLVAAGTGWNIRAKGETDPMPFSPQAAKALFTQFPDLRIQMYARLDRSANFIPASARLSNDSEDTSS